MLDLDDLHPDYITDENGNKKAVILSISDFQELIEDKDESPMGRLGGFCMVVPDDVLGNLTITF